METVTHTQFAWPLPGNRKFYYTGQESDAEFIDAALKDSERYRKMRNADMQTRNKLAHYSGQALDEALDALK